MQVLMIIEGVTRVSGRPIAVYGKLIGGGVRVGQRVVLRLREIERAAVVAELAWGFHRTPAQSAVPGAEVGLWLQGEDLEVVVDGEPWQVIVTVQDPKTGAATDSGGR